MSPSGFGGMGKAAGPGRCRVVFRNTGDGMQIVGKADKSNESKVISRLMESYGMSRR